MPPIVRDNRGPDHFWRRLSFHGFFTFSSFQIAAWSTPEGVGAAESAGYHINA
jgi:hypothetical protein